MTDRIRLDELNSDQCDALLDERDQLRAAVHRARALHARNANAGVCEHCSERDYPNYAVPYPCPTIQALTDPEEN